MPTPLADRIARLATLHNVLAQALAQGLQGKETDELLEAMGCQRKALYGYAQDLRDLGAPVQYEDGLRLWSYTQIWNPPVPWTWTVEGAAALRLSMDYLLDPQLEYDLREVLTTSDVQSRANTQTLPRLTAKFSRALLPHLSTAIRERRVLRFEYLKPSGKTSVREVCPLSVFEWNGMPYLQATEKPTVREIAGLRTTSSIKRFAFSRIFNPVLQDASFKPPARSKQPTCLGAFCADVFTAQLQADPTQAPFVRERQWHPAQTIKEKQDGSVVFTLPFGDYDEAARWVVGQGPGISPLGPPPLLGAWRKLVRQLALQAGV